MVKTVFLDRDGVINHLVNHNGKMTAPWKVEEFIFMSGAVQCIRRFKNFGKRVIVITNQPDVLDGKMTRETFDTFKDMLYYLKVDDVFCAEQRGTEFYKPNNGMIEHYIQKYELNRNHCVLIGDTWKDIVAGDKSIIKTIYSSEEAYNPPKEWNFIQPTYTVKNITEATKLIEDIL